MIDNDDIKLAWDHVARTPEGLVIYRHLQRIRLGIAPPTTDERALQSLEGRRSLAADLMAYMAEGISDNDRACVTFAVAKPVAISAGRGAGRRISSEHFIPGYDTDSSREPAGGNNGSGSAAGGAS